MDKNNHKNMIRNCPKLENPQTLINSLIHTLENCIVVLIVKIAITLIVIVMTEREHKGDFRDVSKRYTLDVAAVTLQCSPGEKSLSYSFIIYVLFHFYAIFH